MAKTYIDENGYKRYSDSGILVHRHVARQKLEGSIWKGYEVHHRNGNKLDNQRDNLQVISESAHKKHHKRKRFLFW